MPLKKNLCVLSVLCVNPLFSRRGAKFAERKLQKSQLLTVQSISSNNFLNQIFDGFDMRIHQRIFLDKRDVCADLIINRLSFFS